MNAFTSRKTILRTLCLSWIVLAGCGSDSPAVKPKLVDKPVASATPEPSSLPPPKLPDEPALPKNPVTSPPAAAAAPKEVAKADTPPAPTKHVLDEFDPEVIGGRPIGKWMEMLRGDKKDDIIEAAEALKQVPNKAKSAIPRLQELSKNADKEIAQEAVDVLKIIK